MTQQNPELCYLQILDRFVKLDVNCPAMKIRCWVKVNVTLEASIPAVVNDNSSSFTADDQRQQKYEQHQADRK